MYQLDAPIKTCLLKDLLSLEYQRNSRSHMAMTAAMAAFSIPKQHIQSSANHVISKQAVFKIN
jgi:hypothetical protein